MSYKYYHHYSLDSEVIEEVVRAAKLEHVNPSRLVESILEVALDAYFDDNVLAPRCLKCGDKHYLTETISPRNRTEWYCRKCLNI